MFIFFYFLSSLSNSTLYKEVRVLKRKSIENREKKRSSTVGRFEISPLCDLCEDGRMCEERSSSGTFLSAIFVKTEERAKSDLHLALSSLRTV